MKYFQTAACFAVLCFSTPAGNALDGDLDPDFGAGLWTGNGDGTGKVVNDFDLRPNSASSVALGVAIQEDGKIVVVGAGHDGTTSRGVVARYLPDGKLDSTFGFGGRVFTPFPGGYYGAVIIHPDGRITVLLNGSPSKVARYTADGALDTTFGETGHISLSCNGSSLAIRPDGKLAVAGMPSSASDLMLVLINSDGTLFASTVTDVERTRSTSSEPPNSSDLAFAVAVFPNNKVVVGGYYQKAGIGNQPQPVLAGFNADGSLDLDWGDKIDGRFCGTVVTASSAYSYFRGLAVDQAGRIIATGQLSSGSNRSGIRFIRYEPNGILDIISDAAEFSYDHGSPTNADGLAIVLQEDGKVLIAGKRAIQRDDDFALARFTPDGKLDSSFGVGGKVATDFSPEGFESHDSASAIALQRDGKIVAAGVKSVSFSTSGTGFALARYLNTLQGSLQLLDGNQMYLKQPRWGAVADGVTRILLQYQAPSSGTVTFTRTNGLPGEAFVGLSEVPPYDSLVDIPTDAEKRSYALYTVPGEFPSLEKNHDVSFTATFTPSGGGASRTVTVALTVERPPVLFVHGFWSNRGTWDGTHGPLQLLPANLFRTYTADYSDSDSAGLDTNVPKILKEIHSICNEHRRRGVAITKVDYVGHSMGGLLARQLSQLPLYRNPENGGDGYIRRLVTIGTPHFGSPWANVLTKILTEIQTRTSGQIAASIVGGISSVDFAIDGGAIRDLQEHDFKLQNLAATGIPCYAIGGNWLPDQPAEQGLLAFLYTFCKNYSNFVGGRLGDRLENGITFVDFVGELFEGRDHDLIVPRESAAGGLDDIPSFYTEFLETPHISVPLFDGETKSSDVGEKVLELLLGNATNFAPGFPAVRDAAPRQMLSNGFAERTVISAQAQLVVSPVCSISSPPDGSAHLPGAQVTVTVAPTSGTELRSVLISIGAGKNLQSSLVEQAPFSATFTIPADMVGVLPVNAFGRAASASISAAHIDLVVRTAASVQSLSITPNRLYLSSQGSTATLHVNAQFSDSIARDVTASATGTIYSSSAPLVATVSANGVVSAVGDGDALITASLGGKSTPVPITVQLAVPNVFASTPSSAHPGDTNVALTISGVDFGGASKVEFLQNGVLDQAVSASNLLVEPNGFYVTANLAVAWSAQPGPRTVVVTTPGGRSSAVITPENTFNVSYTPSQAWRVQYGFPLDGTGAGGDLADPDADGIVNLIERALGTNPNAAGSGGLATVSTEGGFLTITAIKNPLATDLLFAAEVTTDLANSISWDSENTTVLIDNTNTFKARDVVPMTEQSRRFIRLKVFGR